MIPRTQIRWQGRNWQSLLAEAFTDAEPFVEYLQLPSSLIPKARQAAELFPLRVPLGFAELMEKGNPNDPLLRQVLPLADELEERPGFDTDPVGDHNALQPGGLLEKYHDRSLMLTTGACAIHCRYCFRRHFPYNENSGLRDNWDDAIARLEQSEVSEVILSGGDPLSLSNQRLQFLFERLNRLETIKRVRLHTRLPIVLPERIDSGLLDLLSLLRHRVVVVIHCNHPRELSPMVISALNDLHRIGCRLYNQAVLLKGVNDNSLILADLSEQLFDLGVQPYYLHQLDRVKGSAHFEVPETEANDIYLDLLSRLPGYMAPKWVREIPETDSKMPINLMENEKNFI